MKNILLIGLLLVSQTALAEITYKELTTPPKDTLDAERVRIWIPQETQSNCRTGIRIFDKSGKKIRNLYNEMLSPSYYNFYWDKKDDSSNFVPEGDYTYTLFSCKLKRTGKLQVIYGKWERFCKINLLSETQMDLEINLFSDSARITIELYYFDGRKVKDLMRDSLVTAKQIHIKPEDMGDILSGRYNMKVYVGDYSQDFVIRHRKIKKKK